MVGMVSWGGTGVLRALCAPLERGAAVKVEAIVLVVAEGISGDGEWEQRIRWLGRAFLDLPVSSTSCSGEDGRMEADGCSDREPSSLRLLTH